MCWGSAFCYAISQAVGKRGNNEGIALFWIWGFFQWGYSSNRLNSAAAFIPLEYLNWEMIHIDEEEMGWDVSSSAHAQSLIFSFVNTVYELLSYFRGFFIKTESSRWNSKMQHLENQRMTNEWMVCSEHQELRKVDTGALCLCLILLDWSHLSLKFI